MREKGYTAQVVERWNPYGRVRVDLFGFVDIVAIIEGEFGVVGLQTTSQSNSTKRVTKILCSHEAKVWLQAGNRIIVHGWAKKGGKGKRKTWQVVERSITLDDFKEGAYLPKTGLK
jgi:hypothetical protein